jgi:hypothetical protein
VSLGQHGIEVPPAVGNGRVLPGSTVQPIARWLAVVDNVSFCNILATAGLEVIDMTAEFPPRQFKNLVRAYLKGEGLEALATRYKVGQTRLRDAFRVVGVQVRNRSDSQRNRWHLLDRKGREALVAAAHAACRGRKVPPGLRKRRMIAFALAKAAQGTFVGRFELDLKALLEARGVNPISQQPVEGYNLDLGLAPVAVEVRVSVSHPLSDPKQRKRVKRLRKLGWYSFYVWINAKHGLTERAADEIITYYELAQRDPAALSECRVIRGTGEPAARGSHRQQLPGVPTPISTLYPLCKNLGVSRKTT